MKKQALNVRSVYVENEKTANQLLLESFRVFLQRELAARGEKHGSNV